MRKIVLSEELAENIQKDFIEDLTYKEIMAKYSISQRVVKKALNKVGLSKRKSFTNEEKEKMLSEMVSGTPYSVIQEKYGITYQSLRQYARINNLPYKTGKGRKNHFDIDYFSSINTSEKAYWFGFLYADAAIVRSNSYDKSPNRVQVNLSSKDRQILVDFLESLQSKNIQIEDYIPKRTYSENPMSRIILNSKKMCDDMIANGYRMLKEEANGDVFNHVPSHLYSHFIRGIFDGDGSITTGKHFSIIGQLPFIEAIQKIMMENCQLNETALVAYTDKGNGELVTLNYGGKQIEKIYDFLYQDATQFLKRKHTRFEELLSL